MVVTAKGSTTRVFRLHGDLHGEPRVFVLNEGENPVGADPKNAIHLPIRQVSRQHALLRVEGERVRIEDLGSTNGTFVNGVRVRKSRLGQNDWVQFGPVLMTFESLAAEEHQLAISLDELPGPIPTTTGFGRSRYHDRDRHPIGNLDSLGRGSGPVRGAAHQQVVPGRYRCHRVPGRLDRGRHGSAGDADLLRGRRGSGRIRGPRRPLVLDAVGGTRRPSTGRRAAEAHNCPLSGIQPPGRSRGRLG